jgi:hypothetical protein
MNPIAELIGKKVTVYSEAADQERQDIGILQLVEGDWLKIHKENGDTLYFNFSRVRMIKPF